MTFAIHGLDLGVRPRKPRGNCGGPGGQVDADLVLVQQVEHAVEQAVVENAVCGFQQRPRENADEAILARAGGRMPRVKKLK